MPTLTSSRTPCDGVVDSIWVCRHKSSREWQIIVHQRNAFYARAEAQLHMHCGYDEVELVAHSVWVSQGKPPWVGHVVIEGIGAPVTGSGTKAKKSECPTCKSFIRKVRRLFECTDAWHRGPTVCLTPAEMSDDHMRAWWGRYEAQK